MSVDYKNRVYIKDVKDLSSVKRILQDCFDAGYQTPTTDDVIRSCCGRVYVDIGKIRKGSKLDALVSSVFNFYKRPGVSYKQIYVGYDNATGVEMSMGHKIAKAFNDAGIHAYADGDPD